MNRYQPRASVDDRRLAVLDIETISGEEMEDGGFPPWPTHTPVVASILTADRDAHGEWAFAIKSIRFGEHEHPFRRLDELLQGRTWVTFNGRGFNLPVLMLTAQMDRTFKLPALTAAATAPRFGNAVHYDLAERYSNYGSARGASLEMLCDGLGIPAKLDTHGDDVGKLYDEGNIEAIEAYCCQDVASALLLWANCRAMEIGDAAYHASLTYQFARWAGMQGTDHLAPFAEVEELPDLQRQSLIGQIDAAVENAQLDADLRAKKVLDASFTEAITY